MLIAQFSTFTVALRRDVSKINMCFKNIALKLGNTKYVHKYKHLFLLSELPQTLKPFFVLQL